LGYATCSSTIPLSTPANLFQREYTSWTVIHRPDSGLAITVIDSDS